MGYIGAHGVAALHKHKYSGVDHSYVAKYVLQPFWSSFFKIFPLWMPYFSNTLTLAVVNGPTEGLMLIYLSHFFTPFVVSVSGGLYNLENLFLS